MRSSSELAPAKGSLKPIETKLYDVWGEELTAENAWTEYPRPQLVRDQWTNLNGHWIYAISQASESLPPKIGQAKYLFRSA